MLIQIVIFSWVAVILVTAGMQLHPSNTEDLQSIVQSVKSDVDRHLQIISDRLKQKNPGEAYDGFKETADSSTQEGIVTPDASLYDKLEEKAESDDSEYYYGSVKGHPGVDFPDYTDIPRTSFTCSDKNKLPGFYADMDTGCQVFHVCWPDRRESFLCPMGTIFNQANSACDYWYNSNCSLAYSYYSMSSELETDSSTSEKLPVATTPVYKTDSLTDSNPAPSVMLFVSEFMPVKAKIVVYPKTEKQRPKIVVTASTGQTNKESKSLKKGRLSKHSRDSRSLEDASSSTESLDELKDKIFKYRSWEALNNALLDIQNSKSTAHLTPYTEHIPEFFKYWFMSDETPVMVNVKPGTELYEYDVQRQKRARVQQVLLTKLIELVTGLLNGLHMRDVELDARRNEPLQENELQTFEEPLISLNPKFVVKPTVPETKFKEQGETSTFIKSRVQRDTATLNPPKLWSEDQMNIDPETKAALLKSYIKLYKAKL